MLRRPHLLKGNLTSESPHSCVWFDTETDAFRISSTETGQRLRFGWACWQRTLPDSSWSEPLWERFTSPSEFLSWLEGRTRPKTRTYVFAHNLHFETVVLNLFKLFPERGWKLGRAILESPPVILSFRRELATVEFIDTGNWWLHSAAKIGETVGVPKLPMPSLVDSLEEWDSYCRNDVEIIRVAMLKWFDFLRRYDLGGFARTLAGQAFKAYRHRFMNHQIFVHDNERCAALERDSYHGGRVECFFIGRVSSPVWCYDVNSMYPFIMKENVFPCKKIWYTRRSSISELQTWLSDYAVIARVTLRTERARYPLLLNGKLVFPVGIFETALTGPDIKEALREDEIVSITEMGVYEQAPLFRSFVETLYPLRLEAKARGDEVSHYNLKILMNSLYGKFGQSGRVWETVERTDNLTPEVWDELDLVTGEFTSWRRVGGLLQRKEKEPESYHSFPAIAAYVTAYARALLFGLFERAGFENVLYCDTDSLFVTEEGASRLSHLADEEQLGKLKLAKSWPWVQIHGPKDYEAPGSKVLKGVKKSARWIDESTVRQEQWRKLPGLLRLGHLDTPVIVEVEKHLSREYTKGTITSSGRVVPLRLPLVT